jgi:serine phosphatase RsbU (regulator of sigma subunit)
LSTGHPTPRPGRSRLARLVLLAGALFALAVALATAVDSAFTEAFARLAGVCFFLLLFLWAGRSIWRRLFWSVGRRLALSYVLVGVLPLGLIALLVLLTTYMLGGFLLGHRARDVISELRDELEVAAEARLHEVPAARDRPVAGGQLRFADYREGRRVAGSALAPELWQSWLAEARIAREEGSDEEQRRPFVALADGRISMAAVAGDAGRGALVWFEGDLGAALRERSRAWFQLFRSDDPRKIGITRITLGTRDLTLRGLWTERSPEELAEYYRLDPPAVEGEPGWREQPLLLWLERTGELRALEGGASVADGVLVSLAASPRGLFRSLLSTSERADSTAWLALAGVAVLLFEIWMVAAGVAIFMIFGLSRAINRLSRATAAIGRGDFSFRIPVRRRDQLGDLQRSFNAMAEHLGELVQTAAQKEILDKELALAREVQQSLLPVEIARRPGVEISTFFEPSSAIGGDYFDVLHRPGGRLALVVGDVAGHGLAAGLRMAMVKAALDLMAGEERTAVEILARLQRLLRRRGGERGFVTLAFAELDPADGRVSLTNAGHPPAYLVRRSGAVEELAAPGVPLGALAGPPGRLDARLEDGDALVLLSDGIIECRDRGQEELGYERVRASLALPGASAPALLDRLLAAMRSHCGTEPVEDDRTAMVLVYRPPAAATPTGWSPSQE